MRSRQTRFEPGEQFLETRERRHALVKDGREHGGADEDLLPRVAFALRLRGSRQEPTSFGAQPSQRFVHGLKASSYVLTSFRAIHRDGRRRSHPHSELRAYGRQF